MTPQNYLGIYLAKGTATVVCLSSQDGSYKVIGCFSVSTQQNQQQNLQDLATLISRGCAERGFEFSDIAVAMDCAMFMQHSLHSDFTDPKQISATIRFDAEETLATDVTDMALAFSTTASDLSAGLLADQAGSDLLIFTTQRKILSDILTALQSTNLDPVTMEPDVYCLTRFIHHNLSPLEDSHPLFGLLSDHSGYLLVPPSQQGLQKAPVMRTFLVGPSQNRNQLLTREVLVTTALLEKARQINCLKVLDSTGTVDYQQLAATLGFEADAINLPDFAKIDPELLADCSDPVDFAIAYGAALAHLEKIQTMNFRNDFMPYQGKKLHLQKAIRFASYSLTILMITVGLYFQTQLFNVNKNRSRLQNVFAKDYAAVMPGQQIKGKINPLSRLNSELKRIKETKVGADRGQISSQLTLVLQAVNSCAQLTDLNIDTISITAKNINITGDTSSRTNTLKFFDAIKKIEFQIMQQRLYEKDRRDHFSITIETTST